MASEYQGRRVHFKRVIAQGEYGSAHGQRRDRVGAGIGDQQRRHVSRLLTTLLSDGCKRRM
jgi:hypothetical protein